MNTKQPILFFILLMVLSICFAATCDKSDDDDDTEDDDDTTDDDDTEDDDTWDDDDDTYKPLKCNDDVCTDPNSGLMWMKTDHCRSRMRTEQNSDVNGNESNVNGAWRHKC